MAEPARQPPRKVVIVGGGTAGWIAAAALAKLLGAFLEIELIESDEIGTVGVGEATIPQIRLLNAALDIDENDFLAFTRGTFKLGIEFDGWRAPGEAYLHSFGDVGLPLAQTPFHHYWLRHRQAGGKTSLWDYSLHDTAVRAYRFARMERVGNTGMTGLAYAFHFDAGLYARYLRGIAEGLGVVRREGKVVDVDLDGESGNIAAVRMEEGARFAGDLFIDCSGFRALLIGQALGVPYEDWSHWLPCDRAAALPSERTEPLLPYTRATARQAGWQWRIPLQHRTGNGHVFCSEHISEDEACAILLDNLDGEPIGEPRILRFTTGRRAEFWARNCVSLGLASGFMEPLESTSIHLIQSNVERLIRLFPTGPDCAAERAEYNRQMACEFARIRDFLILHYKLNARAGEPFWTYCREMVVPDSLTARMDLFASSGRIFRDRDDLFKETSWLQVMLGQGLEPAAHDPFADRISDTQLADFLANVRTIVERAVAPLPDHADYVAQHCARPPAATAPAARPGSG